MKNKFKKNFLIMPVSLIAFLTSCNYQIQQIQSDEPQISEEEKMVKENRIAFKKFQQELKKKQNEENSAIYLKENTKENDFIEKSKCWNKQSSCFYLVKNENTFKEKMNQFKKSSNFWIDELNKIAKLKSNFWDDYNVLIYFSLTNWFIERQNQQSVFALKMENDDKIFLLETDSSVFKADLIAPDVYLGDPMMQLFLIPKSKSKDQFEVKRIEKDEAFKLLENDQNIVWLKEKRYEK
ncbi:hypothetical protein [Mesomycoplasma lagogenitalium]|uniref:Lipoprotein n=1 Tax=Mesomycoplasma lagogenitalium TaxID=171286 RepID=A0ABY8LUW5_9BACT|nr:hypothetical protein [Mesomycoplasma lagogenitalium]WGI37024.1 hypothetical protein QEG99_01935 [Mesomycoplasma lagogenitalium]